jgi:hypothetical protein
MDPLKSSGAAERAALWFGLNNKFSQTELIPAQINSSFFQLSLIHLNFSTGFINK